MDGECCSFEGCYLTAMKVFVLTATDVAPWAGFAAGLSDSLYGSCMEEREAAFHTASGKLVPSGLMVAADACADPRLVACSIGMMIRVSRLTCAIANRLI